MTGRDAVLDAWRGVAVLLVIGSHTLIHFDSSSTVLRQYPGQVGVHLFFAISGYIITKLLLEEERISLRSFYIRRAFRILPPLALLLALAAALMAAGQAQVQPAHLAAGAAFLCNALPCGTSLGHLWTLAVEEQFYLVWPLLVVLVPRQLLARLAAALAVAFTLAAPFDPLHAGMRSMEAYATLAAGAGYAASPAVRGWVMRMPALVAGAALALVVLAPLAHLEPLVSAAMPVLAVTVIFSSYRLQLQDSAAVRALARVGLVSYGLYLLQQPFLFGPSTGWEWLFIPMAVASYLWLERPLMRLGRQLATRRASEPSPVSA